MPHLVILYTPQLDAETDVGALCRKLADTLLAARDEAGKPVFPPGGTRVLAYAATHHAVSDGGAADRACGGSGDYAFVYANLRMGAGRSAAVQREVGAALLATAKAHLAPLYERRRIGLTLQIDEGREVFDAKLGTIHPLFAAPAPARGEPPGP
ncbi:MAG TPA: 5-carboxymethyl-2-hydroxymuconate isomerase [Rubrivivax sp.]|nr:5-carboxymethyl-2-hydroxymuconate isomerase [Pseudomonadota bacterium]HOL36965.1 5-carboxymethyl-2-hydroxymuconate isomerase [Rubrivivax sp.]HPP81951.1 5-carboxymethyl-2-hydroxymuconate isomerase [Rubrivivax sp.]